MSIFGDKIFCLYFTQKKVFYDRSFTLIKSSFMGENGRKIRFILFFVN